MVDCSNCGTLTKNAKYCSRSCAVAVNNKKPKRVKKVYRCSGCSIEVSKRRQYCDGCDPRCFGDISLGEAIYKRHHRSSAYALVRTRARSLVASEPQVCETCFYDKHVEVCHIRAIKDFPESALLSEINARDNLRLLCPNCHWEFDNL